MSRHAPGRGNGRSDSGAVARGAGFAAAKGAALIGLAVVIGIVLLNVVDDGSDGPAGDDSAAPTTSIAATHTTAPAPPTTADAVPAKTPAELAVLVLNGGAPQGAAKSMDDDLKLKGYTNTLTPSDWSGKTQTGNVVLCKPGLDQEAAALATAVGEGTPVEPFPDPAPPGSESADCVVVVGATG